MRIPERLRAWRPDRLVLAMWAVAVLPLVVATVRAVRRGWLPLGDNALIAIRTADVLTSHNPLLGTWSSASLDAHVNLNHPGPLVFDSMAPIVRLFGTAGAMAVAVMVVNVLAITTAAVFASRCAGRVGALVVLFGIAFLCWVMGSELLFDPWGPHMLILPCTAMIVVAWAVVLGDRLALPVYLALGSYCVQTHLGYAYLVPGLVILALCLRWTVVRVAPVEVGGERERVWPSRSTWAWSVGTVLVCWAQPLYEQFFGAGEGNISRIIGAGSNTGPKLGVRLATRLFASVMTWAPWSARNGFVHAVPSTAYVTGRVLGPLDLIGGKEAVLRLFLLVVVVGATAWFVIRKKDVAAMAALGTAVAASLVAAASMVVMPLGPVGLTAHQMRWLWPIWVFLLASLLFSWWRLAASTPRATIPVAAAIGLVALANLPAYVQAAGPQAKAGQVQTMARLDAQLGSLKGKGTIWFDSSNTPVFDNYSAAVLAELQRRDIPFVVDEPGMVRQLGDARRKGNGPTVHMQLRYGHDALAVGDGWESVAVATSLTTAEQSEFATLTDRVNGGEQLAGADKARYDALTAKADAASVAVVIQSAG